MADYETNLPLVTVATLALRDGTLSRRVIAGVATDGLLVDDFLPPPAVPGHAPWDGVVALDDLGGRALGAVWLEVKELDWSAIALEAFAIPSEMKLPRFPSGLVLPKTATATLHFGVNDSTQGGAVLTHVVASKPFEIGE